MNWADISAWFLKFIEILTQLDILDKPDRIYNIDEHGVEHSPTIKKVIGKKGEESMLIQQGEHSTRSTMVTYINPLGDYVPPLIIHKGKKVCESWHKNKPEGMCCFALFFSQFNWSTFLLFNLLMYQIIL